VKTPPQSAARHGRAETGRSAERPLFLLGPARSGTSLLYRTLCLHPQVAYICNYQRRAPGLSPVALFDRLPRLVPGTRRRIWFPEGSNAYVYGRRRSWLERGFPAPVEGEAVFARCGVPEFPPAAGMPTAANPELAEAFARLRRWAGGQVVVSKRIAHNLRIPLLHATFPEARFVRLVRDGRAVASSLAKVDWWDDSHVWWAGTTPRAWAAAGGDPWEICARNWVEEVHAIDAGLDGVAPEQVLDVRYEAIVDDAVSVITGVAEFAGLDADPAWRRDLDALDYPNRDDAWRGALDADAIATVERHQRSTLVEHGYAV
jgi:hypothetical protein